jgi:hypothetical protein
VENLWMVRAYPVHEVRTKKYFRRAQRETARRRHVHALSYGASLVCHAPLRTIRPSHFQRLDNHHVAAVLHRFEESIAGRPYLIEVASVADNRWRAYIVRIPGVPTALMPFYGRTPLEAAQHLRDWLSRAHARAAGPTPAV